MPILFRCFFCFMSMCTLVYTQEPDNLLEFNRIFGPNRENIIDFIQIFPKEKYNIYDVPNLGVFYLDEQHDGIKDVLRNGDIWEDYIRELIFQYARPESIVLDIGAHIGTHTLPMSQKVGSKGRVLAFEPQPKIFRELFLNLILNKASNVDFYPVAVSDHEGRIELAQLCEGNEGGTSLILQPRGAGEYAPLITIDSLFLNNVSLMKIDVEVMENFVLEGARNTIARCRPVIIIEIRGDCWVEHASPSIKKEIYSTIARLRKMRYKVRRIRGADFIALPM